MRRQKMRIKIPGIQSVHESRNGEKSPLREKKTTRKRIVHVSLADASSKGPPLAGNLAVPIFSHGSLVVELYTPAGHDPQKPHTRDEAYFVIRGRGLFL